MLKINTWLTIALLGLTSASASANGSEPSGLYLGGGIFGATNSDCIKLESDCTYSGQYVELGYDINEYFSVEGKYASGDNDANFDLAITYVGLNIGHDFNTDWFRLYGRVGYGKIEEKLTYDSCYYDICSKSFSNSKASLGLGVRFTLSGNATGLYLKLESTAIQFNNSETGAAVNLGLGYRF